MYGYFFIKKFSLLCAVITICLLAGCGENYQHDKAYADMVIKGDTLWGLTAKGYINRFNLKTNAVIGANIHTDTAIIHMTMDRLGRIIVSDKNQKVKLLDQQSLEFTTIDSAAAEIHGMVYDDRNNGFLLTENGISNFKGKAFYKPNSALSINPEVRGWRNEDAATIFMDRHNNIWIGGDYGEWGGTLFIFNTGAKRFIKPKLNGNAIRPVRAIFENADTVYVSGSLAHDNTSGSILKFINFKADSVFVSETHYKDHKPDIAGEYIGPTLYHTVDSCIYFYSQNGIFKGNPTQNLAKIEWWTKVAKPQLHWKHGQHHVTGASMNVVKMQFAKNGHLYLATKNDGILMIDGNQVNTIP